MNTGALPEAELANLFARFKPDQQPCLVDKVEIPPNISNRSIWAMVAGLIYKMLTRVADKEIRSGECRLIKKMPSRTMVAEIGFSGSISARYLFSVTPNNRQVIARAILQKGDVELLFPILLSDGEVLELAIFISDEQT